MKTFFSNLKKAWIYGKTQKKFIIGYIIFNIIFVFINLFVPILSAKSIVELTSNKLKQVIYIGLIILVVELLRNFANYITGYFRQQIYRETYSKLETTLGAEILKIENQNLDEKGSGLFIQRLTNDASKIADIFVVLNIYLTHILTDIGIFLAIFIINKIIFVYLVIMVCVIFIAEEKRTIVVTKEDKIYRKKNEKVSGFIGELVRGARDIKMLNAETSFIKELDTKIVDLNMQRYKTDDKNRKYILLSATITDLFSTGNILLSVFLITQQMLTIPNALVINNYLNRLTSIIYFVSQLMEKIKDFNLSSERVFSIMESKEFPKEEFGKKHLGKAHGDFEFKNVTFTYKNGHKVIDNMNFKIKANSTVALVGK